MERVMGWFWKGSSTTGDTQETLTTAKTEKKEDSKAESVQADNAVNKNNSAQSSISDSIKPVLYDESDQSVKIKLMSWIQKNTYIQPEDCLTCKLTLTSCATLFLLTGLSGYNAFRTYKEINSNRTQIKRLKYAKNGTFLCLFGMWGVFMYAEWYNAIFYPPSETDRPRSFFERERRRTHVLRESMQKNQPRENDKDDG